MTKVLSAVRRREFCNTDLHRRSTRGQRHDSRSVMPSRRMAMSGRGRRSLLIRVRYSSTAEQAGWSVKVAT